MQTHQGRRLRPLSAHSTLTIDDITGEASRLPAFDGHERVWLGRDEARGLIALVAIHDTRLGPAMGGTRIWPHAGFDAALTDVLRLSRGMTLKAAVAGVPFGGGKAVIIADSRTDKTPALMEAYAEMLASLVGQYITAEDVGLTLADADFLRDRTPNVAGTTIGGSGNPSPVTAHGVFLGLRETLRHAFGSSQPAGRRIAVQGLGAVGWSLCEALADHGASLVVADLDEARTARAAKAFNARPMAPQDILDADVDLVAPCALGGVLDTRTIPQLKARAIAGAANNQLARHEDARLLMERGILYAPDYVINAGGLINIAIELRPQGYDRAAAMKLVERIPATLAGIFARAKAEQLPTNDVALAMAQERLALAGGRA